MVDEAEKAEEAKEADEADEAEEEKKVMRRINEGDEVVKKR